MGKRQSTSAVASNVRSTRRASRREQQRSYDDVVVPIIPNIRKSFSLKDLKRVVPLTDNQEIAFEEWEKGQNLVMDGYAGTGKTYVALYLALRTVLDPNTPQTKIIIAKTPVQSHEIGFLKGDETEKVAPFEAPYRAILNELFTWRNSYDNMKELGIIEYEPMVAVRGVTLDNAIIIVDEIQNMTASEAETIITRSGKNTRIMFCGDDCQNDIGKDSGFSKIVPIFRRMREMSFVNYELQDIVRSGLVKSFLMAKYGYQNY